MSHSRPSPLHASEIMQKYFIENRSRLLDLAAYLDRIQRAESSTSAFEDERIQCLLRGVAELLRSSSDRVDRIQNIFSDQNFTALDGANLDKSAAGAPKIPLTCC